MFWQQSEICNFVYFLCENCWCLAVNEEGGGKTDSSILFRSVVREDGGMYQCLAVNEDEESQAAAQLVLGRLLPPVQNILQYFNFPEKKAFSQKKY